MSQQTPFEVLKTQVYPVLNQSILKLIDHIVKSEQVTKHQERLKKKKIIDQLEKKYIQRQIEKEQMGSDYQESDDESYHKQLGMNKEQVDDMIWGRIQKAKNKQIQQAKEVDPNIFDPIDFIIKDLKAAHSRNQQNKDKKVI